jgi:hypothetical protein
MAKNINFFNIQKINGFQDNDGISKTYSNVTINNSVIIPYTPPDCSNSSENSSAAIFLKDINSNGTGIFYPLNVDSSLGLPELYFNNNIVITNANLLDEFETISNLYPIDFSNIVVNGGYVNFTNSIYPNSNVGPDGVGLRYSSNGLVQFKNYNTDWIDLSDITTHDEFKELVDVDVYTNPLQNNQYITYNATSNLFVNSNLAIINDLTPTLASNLNINGFNLQQNNSNITSVIDQYNNKVLSLVSTTTYTNIGNYVEINNVDSTLNPSINVKGIFDTDIGLDINTKGSGDITLNALNGSTVINSDNINISGYMVNSIYKTSTKVGGYNPNTTWNIPISSDTILFNFNNGSTAGTYYANVSVGVYDGQKLNLVFNNSGIQVINVLVDFGTQGLLCGTGLANGINFDTSGQSSMLIFLGDTINKWQILNTGSGIF